jgi:hypothetical protein
MFGQIREWNCKTSFYTIHMFFILKSIGLSKSAVSVRILSVTDDNRRDTARLSTGFTFNSTRRCNYSAVALTEISGRKGRSWIANELWRSASLDGGRLQWDATKCGLCLRIAGRLNAVTILTVEVPRLHPLDRYIDRHFDVELKQMIIGGAPHSRRPLQLWTDGRFSRKGKVARNATMSGIASGVSLG